MVIPQASKSKSHDTVGKEALATEPQSLNLLGCSGFLFPERSESCCSELAASRARRRRWRQMQRIKINPRCHRKFKPSPSPHNTSGYVTARSVHPSLSACNASIQLQWSPASRTRKGRLLRTIIASSFQETNIEYGPLDTKISASAPLVKSASGSGTRKAASSSKASPTKKEGSRKQKSKGQGSKKRLNEDDDLSDINEEGDEGDKLKIGKQLEEVSNGKKFACPFFKAFPSQNICCRDSGWSEQRKVKDHLKRFHYINKPLPNLIDTSHTWDEWYQCIVADTERAAGPAPNSDANFPGIIQYLLDKSDLIQSQGGSCFGSQIIKLLQQAQTRPSEAEELIQGLAELLERPYSSAVGLAEALTESPNAAQEILASQNSVPVHMVSSGDFNTSSHELYANIEWGLDTSVPIISHRHAPIGNADGISPVDANQFQLQQLHTAQTVYGGESWSQIPQTNPSTHNATGGFVEQWITEMAYHAPQSDSSNFDSVITPSSRTIFPYSDSHMQVRPSGEYMSQPLMQISEINGSEALSNALGQSHNYSACGVPALARAVTDFSSSLPPTSVGQTGGNNTRLNPSSLFAIPPNRRKSEDAGRPSKLQKKGRIGNIAIPSRYEATRVHSTTGILTPSSSVCFSSRGIHSSLHTPALTPYTATTANGVSNSFTRTILVVAGRRPEIFQFSGSINKSFDNFMNWVLEMFAFDFSSRSKVLWYMNSNVSITNRDSVLAILNELWGEGIFFNKVIPWFWIDMPCHCYGMNPPYREAEPLELEYPIASAPVS